MGFYVLEPQSLDAGKGLKGTCLIDHIILDLFPGCIHIPSAESQ